MKILGEKVMKNINFDNIDKLYKKLKPALKSKVKELHLLNRYYINEEDIFDYLCINVWENNNNLELCDLVNDILYLDDEVLDNYVAKNIANKLKKEGK
mgnify:CR=1 FL=1